MRPFFPFSSFKCWQQLCTSGTQTEKIIIGDIEIQTTFLLGNLALHMAQILMKAAHMVVQLQKNQEVESLALSKP